MSESIVIRYAAKAPHAVQVEVKDAKVARSCRGALHFAPGSTRVLTKAEHDYIKANEKEVFRHFQFVASLKSEEKSEEHKPEVAHTAKPTSKK